MGQWKKERKIPGTLLFVSFPYFRFAFSPTNATPTRAPQPGRLTQPCTRSDPQ